MLKELSDPTPNGITRRWWKEAVVYQVYPRSFRDSDGDGIGDLPGLVSKLDHIAGLGVDVVWLNPHFDSPNVDNGYDVRDYRKVMAAFGTMADFDALLAGLKARGIRLILDLVVNHTSDQHAWFAASRTDKDSPYRDFYIWRAGRPDGAPPNDWRSFFSGPAWTRDDRTGEHYLHLFAREQPDLNWDDARVRAEVYDLMRFWLDKGVDGFRMDVIPLISKPAGLPDIPPDLAKTPEVFLADGPRLHDHLREMRREALDPYGAVAVGEAIGVTLERTPLLIDERRGELDMIFHFDAVRIDRGEGWRWKAWTLPELKAWFTRLDQALDRHCWPAVYLANHDNPRLVSHFGDDEEPWRVPSAKLLALLLLTLKGTPFLYQGDEIGMTNAPFARIEDYEDIEARNAWAADVVAGGVAPERFLADMRKTARDHSRTPMQWDGGPGAGFTAGTPWFALNPNAARVNVEADLARPDSIYRFYARLIALRRLAPSLVYGDYRDLDPAHPQVFAYERRLADEAHLVVLNWSREPVDYPVPAGANLVLGNLDARGGPMRPWEARLYRL